MKKKTNLFQFTLLILMFTFSAQLPLFGQEKFNISAGVGIPELINIGARYQIDQLQLGISVGTIPSSENSLLSVSGDFYYHFGGHTDLSARRPWYARFGLTYLRDETDNYLDTYMYLSTRIGRDFNISKKFGMGIDAGAMLELSSQRVEKVPDNNGFNFDLDLPVIPSIGIALFYRI